MSTIDRAALIEQAAIAMTGVSGSREASMRDAAVALPVIAKALLSPLREMHAEKVASYWRRTPSGDDYVHETRFCRTCSADYPCPTVRLLDAIEAEVQQ